jgi:hypothetical protein
MDTYLFLVIVHLIGTALGVGGATFVEIFLTKSLRDGHVDPIESDFLKTTFLVVRVGLILALLSGFGFLLLYQLSGQTFKLYNPLLWAKLTMVIIIAVNALLLQAHKISLYWGSAFSFATWYGAAIAGIFLTNGKLYPYLWVMFFYVAGVILCAIILDIIRKSLTVKA